MKQHAIFQIIYELEQKTALKARWFESTKASDIDGFLELDNGSTKYSLAAIYKKDLKPVNLINIKNIQKENKNIIILSDNIFPKIRETLREMQINYADKLGNCFLKVDNWHFLIDGIRVSNNSTSKERSFTKTALILIFHFLNDKKYLEKTYRQIAEDYQIALGNVNKIINSLKDQGYIIKTTENNIQLINEEKLLEQWINEYEEKLKPSLFIGEFRFTNEYSKDWTKIPLGIHTQWGGEPGADILTGYLQPAELTLYTSETKLNLIKKFRLAPGKGNLKVYTKFWKFQETNPNVVPKLLIYADLINSGDPRNIETARKLHIQDELFRI